jgi:hypothetical protein
MPTPHRAIRVDDITWLHAQQVAEFYDTNVTAMIVQFLQALRIGQKPETTAKRQVVKMAGPKITATKGRPGPKRTLLPTHRPRPEKDRVKVDPATCTHPTIKKIPYGTFCTACGKKMSA